MSNVYIKGSGLRRRAFVGFKSKALGRIKVWSSILCHNRNRSRNSGNEKTLYSIRLSATGFDGEVPLEV